MGNFDKLRTVIIVQARMTSTRLPGKVLKQVLGKSLLNYQIERLRKSKLANEVVIATTVNDTDIPIVDLCKKLKVSYFCGSEYDVLSRYFQAAKAHQADVVVRVTSDCPLIDPAVIDRVIGFYLEHFPQYDYVSNVLTRTYPRGMDTEVVSFRALTEAYKEAMEDYEHEHVTPFFYQNKDKDRYRIANVPYLSKNQSRHRWTVDTPEDFELIKKIIESLYPNNPFFNLEDCLNLLEEHSDWSLLNDHIEQKKLK